MLYLILLGMFIFFVVDFIYYSMKGKRIYGIIRLPFELMCIVVLPVFINMFITPPPLTISVHGIAMRIWNITGIVLFIVVMLPCNIAYFISAYKKRLYSDLQEGILNILLVVGILIKLFMIVTASVGVFIEGIIIVNFTAVIILGLSLIINLKRSII